MKKDRKVIIMDSVKSKNKKIQVNVNRKLAAKAENIMDEIGFNPNVVINSLYKEIVATGKIPLSFSLTKEQRAELELRDAVKDIPVHRVKSKKDLEEFFDDES